MGYKKNNDVIESYKVHDIDYYKVNIEVDNKYMQVLEDINNNIVGYMYNNNMDIQLNNTNSLVLLLKYLHNKVIKNIVVKDGLYNNYSDIELINVLWDIYTNICYKLNIKPTILRFSIFTGINKCTFNRWIDFPNDKRSESVKKWKEECESTLYDDVINNNSIGSIFALKSNYGYKESINIINEPVKDVKSIEAIKEDYNNILIDNNDNIMDF